MNQIIPSTVNLTIRKANLDDLVKIKLLFMNTVLEVCKKDYTEEQLEAWASAADNTEKWKSKLASQFFIIAEMENKAVGFASLECNHEIDMLYVHKDFQQQGIATMLYDELIRKAFVIGVPTLIANVSISAKHFFEMKGFCTIREQSISRKGVLIANYRMQKVLK